MGDSLNYPGDRSAKSVSQVAPLAYNLKLTRFFRTLHMPSVFLHPYSVQTVNNFFPHLRFEMISVRDWVDLCSHISRPDKGIEGKFQSCSIFSCQLGVARELQPERAETQCFTFLPNRFLFLFLSTAGISWVSGTLQSWHHSLHLEPAVALPCFT